MNTELDSQYPEYDIVIQKIIKSKKDLEIVLYIKNMFTEKEIKISPRTIAIELKTSKKKIYDILHIMLSTKLIISIKALVFRLNPYIIIPFGFNGAELQQEWDEIINERLKIFSKPIQP